MRSLLAPRQLQSGALVGILVPVTLIAVALGMVAHFDLGTPAPFNDEWAYRWSAVELATGHGLRTFPTQNAPAVTQVVWSFVATGGHADPDLLRLTIVPFLLLTAWSLRQLSCLAGATTFWSATAAAAFVCSPLLLAVATGFMSDVPYTALLVAAALAGAHWIKSGRFGFLCVVLTGLACLQRQLGVGVPVALTIALYVGRARTPIDRRRWGWILGLYLVSGLAIGFCAYYGLGLRGGTLNAATLGDIGSIGRLLPLVYLAPMVGLLGMPFGLPVLLSRGGGLDHLMRPLPITVAVFGLLGLLALNGGDFLPGNVLTLGGIAPTSIPGNKPAIFPWVVSRTLELGIFAGFLSMLVVRSRAWQPSRIGTTGLFLIALSLTQLLPLLLQHGRVFDRYYLPVVAPLMPVIAAQASRSRFEILGALSASVVIACGVALYAVGEQDYEAWQGARYAAAQLAYRTAPPDQVQAGYEANAEFVALPTYERVLSGKLHRDVSVAEWVAVTEGPEHPKLVLAYSNPSDPTTGVAYYSLAPGKIVVLVPNPR